MTKKKNVALEESLAQIETIISRLDDDGVALEEAMAAFEQGIKLIRQAQETLAQAEQRVQQLVDQNGEPSQQDFSEDTED